MTNSQIVKLLLAAFLSLAQIASADPAFNTVGSKPDTYGISLGEPESMDVGTLIGGQSLIDFETSEDGLLPGENFAVMTDEQLELHYSSAMRETNFWLDKVAADASKLEEMTSTMVAAKGTTKQSGMSAVTCMAAAIQGEAGGESSAGKAAVGAAIMSRAGGSPAHVCSAVFSRAQFESMRKRSRIVNADSLRAAKVAINSNGKCTYDHFINLNLQRQMGRKVPCWVKNFRAWHCPSKQIGGHTFFMSCGCQGNPVCGG